MFTPDGQPADKMDKIMLLGMWTRALEAERTCAKFLGRSTQQPFISAGMGRPTFPINTHTVDSSISYWKTIKAHLKKSSVHPISHTEHSAVIGYGAPQGDNDARNIMAEAVSKWYETDIVGNQILFTVGGAGALRVIFETFNGIYKGTPNYRVITPFPHYTLYADNHHQLHQIDVMRAPGYRLTADILQNSILGAFQDALKDGGLPRVVLLCNPSNPLGTVISENELLLIADVLRQHRSLHIVLDEAYAEMCFSGKKVPSLIKIAPDLMPRIIIMRSATKALSAAGERMAMLMAFDPALMAKLLEKNIGMIGHAPRSGQIAYAQTMFQFTDEEHQSLARFYQPKVEYVTQCLKMMGAQMPDPLYTVDGTFYILADFSDLLGAELPGAAYRALGKMGPVQTNEDLAYYLLFNHSIMLAPGSYFGLPLNNGFLRITCSANPDELRALMGRLESCLLEARNQKKKRLLDDIHNDLTQLKDMPPQEHSCLITQLAFIVQGDGNCLALKEVNKKLQKIHSELSVRMKQGSDESINHTAILIQSSFRRHLATKMTAINKENQDSDWKSFVDWLVPGRESVKASRVKGLLSGLSAEERLEVAPWLHFLSKKENRVEVGPVSASENWTLDRKA